MRSRRPILWLLFILLAPAAVQAQLPAPADDLSHGPLDRDPAEFDFSQNPGLRERILASPYGYFRFTNIAFATEVCRRFADTLEMMPTVNLHGDAHLEQYTITNVGYGLSDFDDACAGPAVLDLVRFSSSIALTCQRRGWRDRSEPMIGAFLDAYTRALGDDTIEIEVPDFTERIIEGFGPSRAPFLAWVESILEPIEPEEAAPLFAGFERYRRLVRERSGHLREGFFSVQSAGRVRIGVGSALDRKYLLRVAGPTDGAEDDVVLEVREVRDLSAIPCIRIGEGAGAFRILLGYSRIGSVPFDFIAPLPRDEESPMDEAEFWVHSWQAHYRELDVEDDAFTPAELLQIVEDAATKLARGHVREIADPHEFTLRRMQDNLVRRLREKIVSVSLDLAKENTESWRRFVQEAKRP